MKPAVYAILGQSFPVAGHAPSQTDEITSQPARQTELIELAFKRYWVFEPSPGTAIHFGINEYGLRKLTPNFGFAVKQVADRIFPSSKKACFER